LSLLNLGRVYLDWSLSGEFIKIRHWSIRDISTKYTAPTRVYKQNMTNIGSSVGRKLSVNVKTVCAVAKKYAELVFRKCSFAFSFFVLWPLITAMVYNITA